MPVVFIGIPKDNTSHAYCHVHATDCIKQHSMKAILPEVLGTQYAATYELTFCPWQIPGIKWRTDLSGSLSLVAEQRDSAFKQAYTEALKHMKVAEGKVTEQACCPFLGPCHVYE